MIILAIETSCDETAAAVVKNGTQVLSNIIATQIDFHKKYGGIVPEIAARKHIEAITPVIEEALHQAKTKFKDLDAVAVTYGPGLVGSLIVGVCAAKAIAYAMEIPLLGVNHLEGHIYANFLEVSRDQGIKASSNSKPRSLDPSMPFICLLVSGGHTSLVLVKGHGKYKVLGQTRDDAAGEAFDKVARFLGLDYPGGPIIDKLAKQGNPKAIYFKRPMMESAFGFDFSFSGIKTAVVNYVNKNNVVAKPCLPAGRLALPTADLVASFQQAIVDVLVDKTIRAAIKYKCQTICLGGGVAANSALREQLLKAGQEQGLNVKIPPLILCTDNAAMIGAAAYFNPKKIKELGPMPNLKL